ADGSPWELTELPVIGVRYGTRTAVVIVPWPHYAELVVGERVGVRFKFPTGRTNATPCDIVACRCGNDPLDVALTFRNWRATAKDTGAIPKPRSLAAKANDLPAVTNLFGAAHIYLWGPALFSRHDVDRKQWPAFAKALRDSVPDTFLARLRTEFSAAQTKSLNQLAMAEFGENWLTLDVAEAIDKALAKPALLNLPTNTPPAEVVRQNFKALSEAMHGLMHDPATWGDGFSLPMMESLHTAGVDRAVLLLSDFYGHSPRPDLAAKAAELGYLLGPYDSYHSVHNPKAAAEATWETAQFDEAAYVQGRVEKSNGSGDGGFKGRGYHLSPKAAWPYVQNRVQGALQQTPFSAWFIDCDATAECFDDYNPLHPATRVDDINARRDRLRWLGADKKLVVGSEGGSILFADVIAFGHGIQTPYINYLSPEFKDPNSPSFIGKFWPSDSPANSFKPIPVPAAVLSPYFDPLARIPFYRSAFGDEVIVTHHWSYDDFKFSDVATERELMELLYMVPPMYHLNRETWPQRRARIVKHFTFWSPLHRQLATAPLTRLEWVTPDHQVQRTAFHLAAGDVTMTVNFSATAEAGYPALSATVGGSIVAAQRVYLVDGK
ncbi:MAG TPA: glycoside hydrolase, partial [Verrucomicrobiae bacterium]|nr:glycoside hydrolase [Verrucomicrobiae bacterium]